MSHRSAERPAKETRMTKSAVFQRMRGLVERPEPSHTGSASWQELYHHRLVQVALSSWGLTKSYVPRHRHLESLPLTFLRIQCIRPGTSREWPPFGTVNATGANRKDLQCPAKSKSPGGSQSCTCSPRLQCDPGHHGSHGCPAASRP
jgi:hypothetical protein